MLRYGGKNVNLVVVVVVISVFVSTVACRASCCFQADACKQVVKSRGDCEIEFVQLRDLVVGQLGIAGERFQQAGRQGCVDLFKQFQVDDAEAIAFGQQAITVGVRHALHPALGPQFGELIAQRGELVGVRGRAQGLGVRPICGSSTAPSGDIEWRCPGGLGD